MAGKLLLEEEIIIFFFLPCSIKHKTYKTSPREKSINAVCRGHMHWTGSVLLLVDSQSQSAKLVGVASRPKASLASQAKFMHEQPHTTSVHIIHGGRQLAAGRVHLKSLSAFIFVTVLLSESSAWMEPGLAAAAAGFSNYHKDSSPPSLMWLGAAGRCV